jgi:hypothetical protein
MRGPWPGHYNPGWRLESEGCLGAFLTEAGLRIVKQPACRMPIGFVPSISLSRFPFGGSYSFMMRRNICLHLRRPHLNLSGFGGLHISKMRCTTEFSDATTLNPNSEQEVRKQGLPSEVLLSRENMHSNTSGMCRNEMVGPEGFEPPTKRL